jgi:DNA-binding NtrC family response regulator
VGDSPGDERPTRTAASTKRSRPPAVERLHLLVLSRELRQFALGPSGEVILGRSPRADLVLDDASVSRRHARIRADAGKLGIVDLGSRNGTRVNGVLVGEGLALEPGDVITLGQVTLVLQSDELPARAGDAGDAAAVLIGDLPAVAADASSRQLFALLRRLAASDIAVLIRGETGAGKEVAVRALHEWSPRRARPLVSVNCAALPDALVESELFGHERGAFSGAAGAKPGLFEAADGGTLLLDEVGDLPFDTQAKLLRALDTGRVTRVGAVRERAVDVRIVSATNRDVQKDVAQNRFRKDLYFRLSAAVIHVPPLRERPADLDELASRLLAVACARAGRSPMALSASARARLHAHGWPGNVRELGNLMGSLAATVAGDEIQPRHLEEPLSRLADEDERGEPAGRAAAETIAARPVSRQLEDVERERMRAALDATGGNQSRAAALIGMPRRTFVTKLKKYRLGPHESE